MTTKSAETPVDDAVAARYVYCILPDIGRDDWGEIGLDGAHVYTIGYQDICALVHNCPAEPYQGDDATVKEWVWTHGAVIDAAWAQTDSVLPMTFDCIVRAAEGHSSDETVVAWLCAEYANFRAQLGELKGKVELGVQIFWQTDAVAATLAGENAEIGRLQREMAGKPKGMVYFYQQKIEKALKQALEGKADADYRRYFQAITALAEDVHVNKVKRDAAGRQMLLNLSLLVRKTQVSALGELLDACQADPGVTVRFTGPWPPYSFVAKPNNLEGAA